LNSTLLYFLNKIVFPEYCVLCGSSADYICRQCIRDRLKVNFKDICHVCGFDTFKGNLHIECQDQSNVDRLYFFCEYSTFAKQIIEDIKYSGNYAIAESVAKHMASYAKLVIKEVLNSNFTITYVPSHIKKQRVRGFNQSELVANKVALLLGVEFRHLLIKTTHTAKQAGNTKLVRADNLRSSFIVKSDNVPKFVMIIDDVHTTGATLNECAKVLKNSGAERVIGFAFSKSLNYSIADK
jgi:competence protein ComFC